ncbi:MAG: MATE family efflux transporter [Lachnospiraceae bacterium]|nr:MATE family efflux transporter [Lachnospiraceae bacterium]
MKKYDSQYDMMTKQPVESLILKLGLPTTISMLVTSIYNMADSYFVGQINTSASGATGIVLGLMAILQAIGFMFGHGAGSIISRKLGAKDIESARKFSATSFYSALIAGILILILAMTFLTPLMKLLGSTDTILPYAKTYASCILFAAPALVSSCVMNNILRYEGRAFFAMIGLTSGGIINIFLDALFMKYMGMGILGAGLATAISQYISWFILLSMFIRKKTQSSFALSYIRFDLETVGDIVTTGLPSLARQGLASISTMLLNNTAGVYGDAAIAAMSIVNRISMFIFSVALGIGQGFQPVAGFNFGAGKYSRVKKGFFFTLTFGTILLGVAAVTVYMNAGEFIRVFRDDPKVIEIGIIAMHAQCISLFFVPFHVCNNMMFQSIGYKFNATLLSTLRNGVCFIPALLILNYIFGLFGIQIAQAIADIVTFFICIPFTVSFLLKLPEDKTQI